MAQVIFNEYYKFKNLTFAHELKSDRTETSPMKNYSLTYFVFVWEEEW